VLAQVLVLELFCGIGIFVREDNADDKGGDWIMISISECSSDK